jgi:hypothetical protein
MPVLLVLGAKVLLLLSSSGEWFSNFGHYYLEPQLKNGRLLNSVFSPAPTKVSEAPPSNMTTRWNPLLSFKTVNAGVSS